MMIRRSVVSVLVAGVAAVVVAGCGSSSSSSSAPASGSSSSASLPVSAPASSGTPSSGTGPGAGTGSGPGSGSGATASPAPSTEPSKGKPTAGGAETLSGVVESGIEPNCLIMHDAKGSHVLVFDDPSLRAQAKAGSKVVVSGRSDATMMTTCQQGVVFVVTSVKAG